MNLSDLLDFVAASISVSVAWGTSMPVGVNKEVMGMIACDRKGRRAY